MRTLELHRWLVTGPTGRRTPSRHLMTEAEARQADPLAEPVPGTKELRRVPETEAELLALSTSAWQR